MSGLWVKEVGRETKSEVVWSDGKMGSSLNVEDLKERRPSIEKGGEILIEDNGNDDGGGVIMNRKKEKLVNMMTRYDFFLASLTFTLVGFVQLFFWNVCLNVLFDITVTLYNWGGMINFLFIIYQSFIVVTHLYLIYVGSLRINLFMISGILLGFLALLLAMISQFATGTLGIVLLHVIMCPIGIVVGILLACGLSIASVMPLNYCGSVCFGMGAAGLFSFAIWMFLSRCIWTDMKDIRQVQNAIWIMCSIASIVSWSTVLLFSAMCRRAWAKAILQPRKVNVFRKEDLKMSSLSVVVSSASSVSSSTGNDNSIHTDRITTTGDDDEESVFFGVENAVSRGLSSVSVTLNDYSSSSSSSSIINQEAEDERLLPSRGWKFILVDSGIQLFNLFFTLWITLQMFPLVGPLSWNGERDIIIGMYQIGDFIGRYVPNLSDFEFPILKNILFIPPRLLIFIVLCRLVFIPLFMISFKLQSVAFFSHLWYHIVLMLTFSISNGWIATLGFIYTPNSVKRDSEKSTVGAMASVSLMFGVVIGLWMSKLYKL